MSEHMTTWEYFNSSNFTKVTCTCGWWDRWSGNDGSAQQSGEMHKQIEAKR